MIKKRCFGYFLICPFKSMLIYHKCIMCISITEAPFFYFFFFCLIHLFNME